MESCGITMAIKHFAIFLFPILLFGACHTEGPDKPSKEDPVLVNACHYIHGGASSTTGGKGGTIYVVTTLVDSINPADNKPIPGTLRYAIEQGEARTVIFNVAGTIHLKKPLTLSKGNITIAGQSAPGDGICIADYPLLIKAANNVIIRFLRFRLGNESLKKDRETDYDALSVNDSKNIVLDHLSCSWSVDECVSCYGNENFTLQYCFITESLRNAGHVKGAHGYGGIWGGKNASFHHNLLAHHDSRNPRFDHDYVDAKCAGPIDYVNNVIYNWGDNSAYGGEGSTNAAGGRHINMVNNYYKYGPATSKQYRIVNPTTKCDNVKDGKHQGCIPSYGGEIDPGKFYITGNYVYGSSTVTNDNWQGVDPDDPSKKEQCKVSSRWIDGLTSLDNEQTAEEAYATVLAKSGCSLKRDVIDSRIVDEVTNGSGKLIDKPSDVGGWPTYMGTPEKDSDYDAIPDTWEETHGLNPNLYADSREQTLVSGYSNLEVYLNAIVADLY